MSEETKSETEKDSPSPGWLLLAAGVVIAVLIVFWLSVTNLISDPAQQGQFGDMFGAANTLFSGLAFAGIIYTIWLQRTELKLQRIELRDTKEELKLSRLAHEKTSKIMDKQLEILEKTSAIEEARYRDHFLPVFVSDTESGSPETGDIMNCIRKIKNTGKVIKDLSVKLAANNDNAELWDMPPVHRAHLITNAEFQINYKSMASKVLPPLVCDVEFTTVTDERKWKCQFIIERTTGASKREFRFTQITERIES